MRFAVLPCIALLFSLLISAAYAQARINLKDLDKPIELDAGKYERMYVIFNHSTHKEVACRTCHHVGLPGNRYAPCTSEGCHSIQGASSRDPMSVYMAYHAQGTDRSCYGCHKPLAGKYPDFRGCRPCHETMMGKVASNKSK